LRKIIVPHISHVGEVKKWKARECRWWSSWVATRTKIDYGAVESQVAMSGGNLHWNGNDGLCTRCLHHNGRGCEVDINGNDERIGTYMTFAFVRLEWRNLHHNATYLQQHIITLSVKSKEGKSEYQNELTDHVPGWVLHHNVGMIWWGDVIMIFGLSCNGGDHTYIHIAPTSTSLRNCPNIIISTHTKDTERAGRWGAVESRDGIIICRLSQIKIDHGANKTCRAYPNIIMSARQRIQNKKPNLIMPKKRNRVIDATSMMAKGKCRAARWVILVTTILGRCYHKASDMRKGWWHIMISDTAYTASWFRVQ
jgi:hypothetical protein